MIENESLIAGLNPQQVAAVEHRGSPLLIVAGAGSGKTRVLTRRIAHLIYEGGIAPWEILAITFTNKAAGEMKERVAHIVGERAKSIWISTFHSACVRILRYHAADLGMTQSFAIYDSADALRLLAKILKDLKIEDKRYSAKIVASKISNSKNELIGPADFTNNISSPLDKVVADIYTEYERRLKLANAFDFDDLILKTVEILQRFPQTKAKYRSRFKHILVDEYQDTNHAQYILIRELVGQDTDPIPPAELCVVGDADQSIYGFRGANIRNILQFESDYSNARTILLEENYRSTQNILSAANAVIQNNSGRKEKNLWSSLGAGNPITGYIANNDKDEASFVMDEIKKLCENGECKYSDIAIFYRTNAQSRPFEEAFISSGIPYKVVGGVRFYERREVKDFLAYLKVVVNPSDEVALRRIINTPKRGIGDRALDIVDMYAAANNLSLWDAFTHAMSITELPNRSAIAIRGFVDLITELQSLELNMELPSVIAAQTLDQSGLKLEYDESEDPQDESRKDNLEALINVAREYEVGEILVDEVSGEIRETSLAGFLERVALVADSDQLPNQADAIKADQSFGNSTELKSGQDIGQVILMTIHTAKGLEFPTVFLTGMEQGIFPHSRTLGDDKEVEEERRLAYVALTRSKNILYITRSAVRMERGVPNYFPISQFVNEIPEVLIEWRNTESSIFASPDYSNFSNYGNYNRWDSDGGHVFGRSVVPAKVIRSTTAPKLTTAPKSTMKSTFKVRPILAPPNSKKSTTGAAGAATQSSATAPLIAGDKVVHESFGQGVVNAVEGEGDRAIATITFASVGEKRLMLRFAPVVKL